MEGRTLRPDLLAEPDQLTTPALLPRPRTITASGGLVRGQAVRESIGRESIGGSLPPQGYRLVVGA